MVNASTIFNIEDYGAVADGKTDCTEFIQKAIDDAATCEGVVFVPSGKFLCGKIQLREHMTLQGNAAWSYRRDGGSTLVLCRDDVDCMIDITGAYGCSILSLCINGNNVGKGIHGLQIDWGEKNPWIEEDTPRIDGCKISHFTGDGIYLNHVWCFSLRHNMISDNEGNGLYIKGWDGFILDNWFSGNRQYGIYSDEEMSSITITSNRVEWNFLAGFKFLNPINVNVTGNYFDASGGPALDMDNPKGKRAINVTMTGNIFHRSGMPKLRGDREACSCHVVMTRCMSCVLTSNVFYYGIDDNGNSSMLCPQTGIMLKKLKNCVITNNTMMNCSTETVCVDSGEHEGKNTIEIYGTAQDHLDEFWYPFFED